jgi:putative ABC transport system permease protein
MDSGTGGTYATALSGYQRVQEFNEVESVAAALSTPYSFGSSSGIYVRDGRELQYERNEVTDDLKDVLDLDLVRGRWFSKEDNGLNWKPVVINESLARDLLGSVDPIGKNISHSDDKLERRVIGVVSEYRRMGELSAPNNQIFFRTDLNNPKHRPPRNLLIKMRPGVTPDFEPKLIARLQAVAKDWSFEINTLEDSRDLMMRVFLTPVIVGGTISGFMIIMVVLGLMGVLWQNVTQRTKEIGLRRAKGATAGRIYNQILGELALITTFGVLAGIAVIIQFPLLDLIGSIGGKVYTISLIISLVLIYLLTLICGVYPARLATRVQPAEALHYE